MTDRKPSGPPPQSDSPDEDLQSKANQEAPAEPPWWVVVSLSILTVVMLAVYAFNIGSFAVFSLIALVAVAALCVGALLGFLFGIPRGPQDQRSAPDASQAATNGASPARHESRGSDYTPNTNLEQVSDWLTKILIGVGLVEFKSLRDALAAVGSLVSKAFAPELPSVSIVSQATVVVFAIIGFLAGFLWTRVYYGAIQSVADAKIRNILESFRNRIHESEKAISIVASGKLSQARPASGTGTSVMANLEPPVESSDRQTKVFEKISKFQSAPVDYDSDPTGDLFGSEAAESNGRRLSGKIDVGLNDALILVLRVEAIAGSEPLVGDAIFLLHPTIQDPLRHVSCENNSAEVRFYSQGWFHVAAIVDEGRTVLVLDLRKIPNVPDWFKAQ